MAKTFEQAMKLIETVFKRNSVILHKEGSASMGQEYAQDTPVDTGRATGSWRGSVNSENLQPTGRNDKSLTAFKTKQAIVSDLSRLKYKNVAYIQNAVQGDNGSGYIIQLEHGKSSQAPNGMFMINNNRAKKVFDNALARLK